MCDLTLAVSYKGNCEVDKHVLCMDLLYSEQKNKKNILLNVTRPHAGATCYCLACGTDRQDTTFSEILVLHFQ